MKVALITIRRQVLIANNNPTAGALTRAPEPHNQP